MSRLLLDTHTLLWSLFSPERLSAEAREAILDPSNDVLVSVISAWELAIKRSIGKLNLPGDIEKAVGASGYRFIGIDPAHCQAYGDLPLREDYRDPFDRMLVVQSRKEGSRIVSRDKKLDGYDVDRI